MRVAEPISIDAQTERELRKLSNGRRVEARVKQRASVILLAAQGWQNKDIAEEVRLDRRQVALWRRRFIDGGLQALMHDARRAGRTPSVSTEVEQLILRTAQQMQPLATMNWSTRSLASYLGLSESTVRRVWQRNGVKPHGLQQHRIDQDLPRCAHQRIDVMALYVNACEHALVLGCVAAGKTRAPRRTRGLNGEGVDSGGSRIAMEVLVTSLETLNAIAMPMSHDRQGHWKCLRFLRLISRKFPEPLQLHLIVESHPCHLHPAVQSWLAANPRVVVHWQSPDGSWFKQVKRTLQALDALGKARRDFTHLHALVEAIQRYVERKPAKPFAWAANDTGSNLAGR